MRFVFALMCCVVAVANCDGGLIGTNRNTTNSSSSPNRTDFDREDALRAHAKKYYKDCSMDSPDDDSNEGNLDRGRRFNQNADRSETDGYWNRRERNRNKHPCEDDEEEDQNCNRHGYNKRNANPDRSSSDSYRNRNNGRRNNNKCNNEDDDEEDEDGGNRNNGRRGNSQRNNNNNNDNRRRYPNNPYPSFGGQDFFRTKRSGENSECTSQCVFGYMKVLDYNKIPSEAAFIKYLQDNIQETNKRIKALREIRMCFGRLSSKDGDDGCQFSKSLSDCLNLDIEK